MIAVTGATGFIGSHVAAQLVARGDEVRVLVRDRSRLAPALAAFVEAPSSRVVANYLRGRLPMMFDSVTTFAGVEDVAAGHLLAAELGRPGESYVLGAESLRWSDLIALVRELSGVENPVLFLPPW